MAEDESQPRSEGGTRFTVDLSEVELTDEEVSSLKNKITKAAVESARGKGHAERRPPYVRIVFVKSVPNPPIK